MLFSLLPCDYATVLAPGDRLRRSRRRATGIRVRRTSLQQLRDDETR
jgi:hypothetical protein